MGFPASVRVALMNRADARVAGLGAGSNGALLGRFAVVDVELDEEQRDDQKDPHDHQEPHTVHQRKVLADSQNMRVRDIGNRRGVRHQARHGPLRAR